MDTKKDNNLQSTDKASTALSQTNAEPISFFEKDESFVFLYKKTEKLTTALYMVTNLFSDNEPMKWALRKKVSDLLSFTVGYKDMPEAHHADFAHSAKTRVLEIVSLLEVSSRSGLVSPMNFSILKQEFSHLLHTLDSYLSMRAETSRQPLPASFFDVSQRPHPTHNPGTGVSLSTSTTIHPARSEHVKDNKNLSDMDGFKKTNRQNIILGLLKKKKELTIKDIAQVIRDCSEKTIQRELIALITAGIIRKTGERRWSKYSLVSQV